MHPNALRGGTVPVGRFGIWAKIALTENAWQRLLFGNHLFQLVRGHPIRLIKIINFYAAII